MASMSGGKPRLVVLGCGFGGYSLLSRLSSRHWDLTLVSPRNYFLFTPLLPSAAVGTVEFRSILEPARRRLPNVRLLEAEAEEVDWQGREVWCRSAVDPDARFPVPYDYLVVAVGARVADFGVPGVHEHAVPLYTLDDARKIRRRILEQFAKAEVPGLPEEELVRRLTFVVCGGGPTGVEAAAEIHDLVHEELREIYPELARYARIVVVEALEQILSGFDQALGDYAREHFTREGIEVRTGAMVEAIEPGRVRLEGRDEPLEAGLVVWAGGNAPVPFVESLDLAKTERGRLIVDKYLRLSEREDVYALGDCANLATEPLPATAQVAQKQGKYLAQAFERGRRGREVREFDFRSSGMMTYVGSGQALADLPQVKWTGRTAWFFWRSVYVTRLVSLANKVKVLFDWVKTTAFGRDVSRFST